MMETNNETDEVVQTVTRWQQIEPWHEPVGVEIFQDIEDWMKTYLHISDKDAFKAVLWAAQANLFTRFRYTPRLVITAPGRGCGKTLLGTVLHWMTDRSMVSGKMTDGAFVRYCANGDLVFFWDEADQSFNNPNSDATCALNNGWEKGGAFDKCVGDAHEPTVMPVWAAVCLMGINLTKRLKPATLDRSIVLQMEKAMPGDLPERFRHRKQEPLVRELGRMLKRWCIDNAERIEAQEARIPDEFDDRTYFRWEGMMCIAQCIGDNAAKRCLSMLAEESVVDDDSKVKQFLRDSVKAIRQTYLPAYGQSPTDAGLHQDVFKPGGMAFALCDVADEDDDYHFPWSRYHADKYRDEKDARIKGRDVSGFMRSLGYKPTTVRWGSGEGDVVKGFKVSDLLMAKKRNAPSPDDDYVPGSDRNEDFCNPVTGYREEVVPF